MRWEGAGAQRPGGLEIFNPKLESALLKKRTFTKQELDSFALPNLTHDSYIRAGDSFFKPVVPPQTSELGGEGGGAGGPEAWYNGLSQARLDVLRRVMWHARIRAGEICAVKGQVLLKVCIVLRVVAVPGLRVP